MKGKLVKTEHGWFVRYKETTPLSITTETLPLHPADVEQINKDSQVFDNIEARIASNPEVEFEIITEYWSGEVGVNGLTYAKLINHSVDSNEMIDHIGDANKMVEDDVEKLAEEFYPLNDDLYPNSSLIRKAFKAGYNKAKETLYTKEELMDAIRLARQIVYKIGANDYCNTDEEIIQSLKQPKKD